MKGRSFYLYIDLSNSYSKLLSLFYQSNIDVESLYHSILTHIGIFSLDPNRVFDMMLDVSEFDQDRYPLFSQLFHYFKMKDVDRILLLKVNFFKNQEVNISEQFVSLVEEGNSNLAFAINHSINSRSFRQF